MHDGMPGCFEGGDFGVLDGVGGGLETQVGEEAIISVNVGIVAFEIGESLAVDRDDALAVFSG
jgi:hypothetical protein